MTSGKALTTVFDTVCAGLSFASEPSGEEKTKLDKAFDQSSQALSKRCCATDKLLKLVGSLAVEQDPTWGFPLPYRKPDTGLMGERGAFFAGTSEQNNRINAVRDWALQNGAKNWKPMKIRVLHGAEASVQGLQDAFNGRVSAEKLLVAHPL